MALPPDRVRFSSSRSHSETLIHLPGGVTLLLSIHNELSLKCRKSLLRRVFRQLKPVLREIHAFYHLQGEGQAPELTRHLDYRAALRSQALSPFGLVLDSRKPSSQNKWASVATTYHASNKERSLAVQRPGEKLSWLYRRCEKGIPTESRNATFAQLLKPFFDSPKGEATALSRAHHPGCAPMSTPQRDLKSVSKVARKLRKNQE